MLEEEKKEELNPERGIKTKLFMDKKRHPIKSERKIKKKNCFSAFYQNIQRLINM